MRKIKELELKIKELEKTINSINLGVVDHNTKFLIREKDAVEIEVEQVVKVKMCYLSINDTIKYKRYYLKGTEPQCDYIKIDLDGKETMYKNNVNIKEIKK